MRQKYINECKIIKQNCEYTAETHHIIAIKYKKMHLFFQIIPAIITVITGSLVVTEVFPIETLWLTIISSVIVSVSSILNPRDIYQNHLKIGKSLILLKHDARFLYDVKSSSLNDKDFQNEVQNLHNQYNIIIETAPLTDDVSFEKARVKIKNNIHEPDKDSLGEIK